MSDFMKLCMRRQSCRQFADRPIEREKLMACAEAARLAPSGCNAQPWHLYLVNKPDELVKQVGLATQEGGGNVNMHTAKAFFVITEEYAKLIPRLRCILDSQYFAHGDIGALAAIICFEAEAQGLGSCILGVFNREKLCELLKIPVEKRIRLMVALGYPEDAAVRDKIRKPIEEILTVYE